MNDIRRPAFPLFRPEVLAASFEGLARMGKPMVYSRRYACVVCRRDVGHMAWLVCLGAPCCADPACALVRSGDVTGLFPTPYGVALSRTILSVFTRLVDLPEQRVGLCLPPILARSQELIEAYGRLLRWQEVYDAWEWHQDPQGYAQGKVQLVPPRWLDDVLVLRSRRESLPRDPVEGLPPDTAALLRRAWHEGTEVLDVPF